MEKKLLLLLFLFSDVTWAREQEDSTYIQGPRRKLIEEARRLTLTEAIEEGLRKNHQQQIRHFRASILQNTWKDTKYTFFMPEIKLTLQTRPQRLGSLSSGRGPQGKIPYGSLGLELSDYTIFNWGKDYLSYLNHKQTFHRESEKLGEEKRTLRHQVIELFFRLSKAKKILEIKKEQLRQASFVYRLTHEKILTKKASKQDYYLSRTEYLRSQTEYQQARNLMQNTNEELAILLADNLGTVYRTHQILKFTPLQMTLKDGLALANKLSPHVRDAKVQVENAQRNHRIVQWDNLPLPKLSITLGAYKHNFGSDASRTFFENEMGGSSVEMVATINASWTLTGKGGLFNTRKSETSLSGIGLRQKQMDQAHHYTKLTIRQLYDSIYHLENNMKVLKARAINAEKSFDTALSNYTENNTSFLSFKTSLEEKTGTHELIEEVKFRHLQHKLQLAKLIGIANFPGENFEYLAEEYE